MDVMQQNNKKLYRYVEGRIFAGVLMGFAKYFSVDVTMLRVLFVLLVLITGFFPGIVAYIIAIFIMPIKDDDDVIIIHDIK